MGAPGAESGLDVLPFQRRRETRAFLFHPSAGVAMHSRPRRSRVATSLYFQSRALYGSYNHSPRRPEQLLRRERPRQAPSPSPRATTTAYRTSPLVAGWYKQETRLHERDHSSTGRARPGFSTSGASPAAINTCFATGRPRSTYGRRPAPRARLRREDLTLRAARRDIAYIPPVDPSSSTTRSPPTPRAQPLGGGKHPRALKEDDEALGYGGVSGSRTTNAAMWRREMLRRRRPVVFLADRTKFSPHRPQDPKMGKRVARLTFANPRRKSQGAPSSFRAPAALGSDLLASLWGSQPRKQADGGWQVAGRRPEPSPSSG